MPSVDRRNSNWSKMTIIPTITPASSPDSPMLLDTDQSHWPRSLWNSPSPWRFPMRCVDPRRPTNRTETAVAVATSHLQKTRSSLLLCFTNTLCLQYNHTNTPNDDDDDVDEKWRFVCEYWRDATSRIFKNDGVLKRRKLDWGTWIFLIEKWRKREIFKKLRGFSTFPKNFQCYLKFNRWRLGILKFSTKRSSN